MRIDLPCFVVSTLMLAGCAGPTFAPDAAPEYLVNQETPLYHYGPQQAGAPEQWLHKDERVRMLRHEFGFSFVQSGAQETGYVGNESLVPAPPLPRPAVEASSAEHDRIAPLPISEEPPLPKPDLEAPPPDAPSGGG